MPKLNSDVPKYRKHKQSGQAICTLNGKDHLLGPHGTKASRLNYDRLIGEWLERGRRPAITTDDGITIVETIARYWQHRQHYVKNGKPTGEQAGSAPRSDSSKTCTATLRPRSSRRSPSRRFAPG